MKHAASRQLHAYWGERRGKRSAPERADIEPGTIRQVLSDAFILALDGRRRTIHFGSPARGSVRYSVVSSKAGHSSGLWAAASQPIVSDLLAILTDERVGTVAGVAAQSADGGTGRPRAAAAAACAPVGRALPAPSASWRRLKVPQWLGSSPIGRADFWAAGAILALRLESGCCRVSLRRDAVIWLSMKAVGVLTANEPLSAIGPSR